VTDDARRSTVDPRLDRVVALIRSVPLRWSDGYAGGADDAALSRGWFSGADECARVLATQAPLEICDGCGFGVIWPILKSEAWTLAPALPAAVGVEAAVGVDGEYRRDTGEVWREAVGAEDLFLTADVSQRAPGAPFDLLWFGDSERYTMRDGMLEVEDLFGVLRTPGSPRLLDRLLIRSRRVEGGVLAGLPTIDREGPQTIEVRRPQNRSHEDRWRDVSDFLAARTDIESARSRGAVIEALLVAGTTVVFECDEDEDGWLLRRREGRYVFSEIRLARRAKTLNLSATLDRNIDAMAQGMRGRLIFDLRADLVTLG
jgi:hypothetical protein